jgi:tRNA 2-thiouridine synthesizing protein A
MTPLPDWTYDAAFDGGDTGCGELLLDLLLFTKRQPGGAKISVLARDPGASREIPAWTRLVGHELVEAKPPYFLIKTSKNDKP